MPLRDELLQSMHAIANHAAVIDTCSEALAAMVEGLVSALEVQARLIEANASRLENEFAAALAAANDTAKAELLATKEVVDDLVGGSRRLVATVHAARKVVQRGGD